MAREAFLKSMIGLILLLNAALVSCNRGGPMKVCEEDGELVADSGSCTRYHRCRKVDTKEEYTTDIAICSYDKVYDMVSSACVDGNVEFLQDPNGCSTFYGCHPTRETSEGFVRSYYTCPGDLRFHPREKFCTFKTDVTDNLCNSETPDQRIIGDVEGGNEHILPTRRHSKPKNNINPNILKRQPNDSKLRQPDHKVNLPTILTRFSSIPLDLNSQGTRLAGLQTDSNLDRIAQLISGQLLSLHGKEAGKTEGKTDAVAPGKMDTKMNNKMDSKMEDKMEDKMESRIEGNVASPKEAVKGLVKDAKNNN